MKFAVNNKTNTKYFPVWVPCAHVGNGNVEELWVICKDSFCISYRENCELDIIFTEMTDGEVVNGRDLAVSFEFQELLAAVATENREDPLAEMLTQYIKLDFPENGISKDMDTEEITRRKQLFVEWFDQMTEQLSEGTCRYFFEGMNEPFGGKEVLTASQQFQTTRFLNGTDTVFNGICRQNENGGMMFVSLSELMESQCEETELTENPDGNTLLKNLEIFCDYYAENHAHYIGVGKKRYGKRENVSVCRYIGKGIPVVKIPPVYSGAPVSRIDEDAFRECDIEEIYLPNGVEIIGNHAFEDCLNLKKIHLPMGIKQMDIETIPYDCVLVTESVCDFVKELCGSDRNIHNIGYELEDGTVVGEDMKENTTDFMEELPPIEESGEFSQNLSALSEEISDLLVEVEQALDKSEKNEQEENSAEEEMIPEVEEVIPAVETVSEEAEEIPPMKEEIDTIANKLAELEAILEARNMGKQVGEEKISIQIPEEKEVDFVIPNIMPELLDDVSGAILEESSEEELIPEVSEEILVGEEDKVEEIKEVEEEASVEETVEELPSMEEMLASLEDEPVEEENIPVDEPLEEENIAVDEPQEEEIIAVDKPIEELFGTNESTIEEVTDESIAERLENLSKEILRESTVEERLMEEPSIEELKILESPVLEEIPEAVVEEIAMEESEVDEIMVSEEGGVEEIVEEIATEEEPEVDEIVIPEEEAVEEIPEEVVEEITIEEAAPDEIMVPEEAVVEEVEEIVEEIATEEEPEVDEIVISEEEAVEEIPEEVVEEIATEEELEVDEIVIPEEEAVEEIPEEVVEEIATEEELEVDEIVIPEEEAVEEIPEEVVEEIATEEEPEIDEIMVPEEEAVEEESVEQVATKVSPLRITIGEKGNSFIALNMPVEMLQMIGIHVGEDETYPIMLLGNYIDCAIEDHIIKYNLLTKEMTRKTVDENVVALLNSSVSRIAKWNDSYRTESSDFTMLMNAVLSGDYEVLNDRLRMMDSFLKFVEEDGCIKVKDETGEIHSMQEVLWMISQNA